MATAELERSKLNLAPSEPIKTVQAYSGKREIDLRQPCEGQVVRAISMVNAQQSDVQWEIRTEYGVLAARSAASCLLLAQPGDAVLLMFGQGQWWITAILHSPSGACSVLQVPGAQQLTISAPELTLQARQACRIQSDLVELEAQQLDVRSTGARLTISALQLAARCLTAMAQRMHLMSDHIDTTCRARTVRVEEMDSLSARHITTTADETHTQQAGQLLINARGTIRMDGERILMG
jgi:hypothetical protein